MHEAFRSSANIGDILFELDGLLLSEREHQSLGHFGAGGVGLLFVELMLE
jgi:hypothetical protein